MVAGGQYASFFVLRMQIMLVEAAGTRVNGIIGTVEKAGHFSLFRGQAYMNPTFRSNRSG